MNDNDLLSNVSSPLDNSVEKVIYLGLAFIVVIFLFITIVYIIGVIRKNKSLKETAFNMFSSVVYRMSFLFVGGVITAAVFTFILMGTYKDQEWKDFASQHCQIIEKKDGQSTSGVGVSLRGQIGAVFGSSSPQTVYKCDDGITYTKNN
ncbi:hypothetical protein Q2Q63_003810 [Escherichia coli]|uniref:hypothetical protein n=1 Tax=Escherichia coli TaxID=562 RepID=UPI00038FAD3B|nr:hypothetical protein [Escherichia coli]EHB4028357.1 hypothetical protein [Salmonella enterica subsp. enterica serovar Nessziona]HBS7565178.1 hypothetical protein [Klebsiella pneumoniae]ELM7822218.1 hypothetical protein [Escherichia coli]ELM8110714.1 hypothetical protein [Escherichia coli]ELM8120279.1 hypothetical protein [Escherichia coli]